MVPGGNASAGRNGTGRAGGTGRAARGALWGGDGGRARERRCCTAWGRGRPGGNGAVAQAVRRGRCGLGRLARSVSWLKVRAFGCWHGAAGTGTAAHITGA